MQDGLTRTWQEVANQHHEVLLRELALAVEAQIKEAVSGAVTDERLQGDQRTEAARAEVRSETLERTRRSVSDTLNQTLRRLRQAPSEAGVLTLLVEASSPWAEAAAMVLIPEAEGDDATVLATRNLKTLEAVPPIRLRDAAALEAVVEGADPVTSLATPAELSPALSAAFGEENKAYLLPVAARGRVAAILITGGDPVTGALELLAEAAGMRLEALIPAVPAPLKPLPAPGLVQITPQSPATEVTASATTVKWNDLTPAEQKDHLHAQRIARVRVAEFRLYHAEALREGVFSGNIYGALREQIEQARTDFLQNCLSKSPSMVDYLHLEILRSLAHDDERLLGSDYPGPMV